MIFGNVKSSEGQNLKGVALTFHSDNQASFFLTDSLGIFTAEFKPNLVNLSINCFGFEDKNLNFNLKKDTILSLVLKKNSSLLREVVVTNDKKKPLNTLSGGKLLFNLKELASMPSVLGVTDVIKLLQLTPGVQNSGDANGYLYVRGGDPGHNSILYAGTPIYGMSHLLGVFPFYNADHIKEVEFDKSSSNAKYGGRLSSTTLLSPDKKVPSQFYAQGNIGILASQLTLAVPMTKKSGFIISGRRTYIDEIVSPILNSFSKNSDVQDLKYGFFDSNLTFISEISKNNLFTFNAFLSADKLKIAETRINLNASLEWSNFALCPELISKLSPNTSMSNAIYYTQYSNNLDMKQATLQMGVSSNVQDFGYFNSVRFFINKTPFESGFQFVSHHLQPQKIVIENFVSGNNVNQNKCIDSNESAVFITSKPKISDKLFPEFGLRLNYYTSGSKSNSFLDFQPRIVLNYIPNEKYSFFASYNKQNQYLHLITTSSVGLPTDFWIASSDGIPSQSSVEFSIGSNQKISKNVSSTLGGFYRSMKNLLEYPFGITQFNEITTLKNDLLVGKGNAYGLETMLRKSNGKFYGWLSYTLSFSNRDFDELNNGKTYFAKYDRRHNLSLVAMYDLSLKWKFGLTQIFSSGNHFTMPTSWYFINNNPVKEYSEYNNAQMPNYIRTDLSVNYFFVKNTQKESALNFSVYNTFNTVNPVYVVLDVTVNENKDSAIVKPENKYLYKILPSISWRFKF